jgi:bloom syndrome protein
MTRTNLGQHLAWLLNRGPSLFPSLDLSTRSDEGATTVVTTTTNHPVSALVNQSTVNSDQQNSGTNVSEVIVDNDGDIVIADADMARLEFAPSSAAKPRMLSCVNNTPSGTPKTPRSHRTRELDIQQRSSVEGSIKMFLFKTDLSKTDK